MRRQRGRWILKLRLASNTGERESRLVNTRVTELPTTTCALRLRPSVRFRRPFPGALLF